MLKSSRWIKQQSEKYQLISPFIDHSIRKGVISYGLGPYGYDLRLASTYKRLKSQTGLIDPHQIEESSFDAFEDERIILTPGSYILGMSMEFFRMPKKILGIVFGKSTYARAGVLVNVTPLEPEWSGCLTISIFNTASCDVALHAGQGIAQVIFIESKDYPLFSYRDLKGKYNNQSGITIPKVQKE